MIKELLYVLMITDNLCTFTFEWIIKILVFCSGLFLLANWIHWCNPVFIYWIVQEESTRNSQNAKLWFSTTAHGETWPDTILTNLNDFFSVNQYSFYIMHTVLFFLIENIQLFCRHLKNTYKNHCSHILWNISYNFCKWTFIKWILSLRNTSL